MKNSAPEYWAFISYSHHDEAWGTWLHRALERYKVPRHLVGREGPAGRLPRRLKPIFRDRDELPSASDLEQKINDALTQSRFLIIICSPHAAASRYVNAEVETFKQLGRSDRILCLIVDGEPGASDRPDSGLLEAFPEAVRYSLDGQRVEPLAADARPERDGKNNAKLKVLAGLLGVSFDDLKQRDARRRRWRIAQAAAVALGVIGVVAGVWWNRQQAVRKQSLIAEARSVATESLEIPERESRRRIELALLSVKLTHEALGYALPEAEIALYRALNHSALRGEYRDSDEGGWTWPVALSRTGDRIVAPAATGPTLMLNELAETVAVLSDPEQPYENDYSAFFSRDDLRAVTGGSDGVVRFWSREGELLRRLQAHASDVLIVNESADGKLLLTVGCDDGRHQTCKAGSARLWDLVGNRLATFTHKDARVIAAALSPDSSRVITVDDLGTYGLWLTSGKASLMRKVDSYWIEGHNFSPDGQMFSSGGCHPFLYSGMFSPLPRGHRLCPGRRANSGSDVRVYDKNGRLLRTLDGRLAAFDPRGSHIATAREICDNRTATCRGRVHLWHEDNEEPVAEFDVAEAIVDLRFSPDGQFVAAADEGGTITLFDATGKGAPHRLAGFLSSLTSFRFSGDGGRMVSVSCPNGHQGACLERAIHVWDPNGSLVSNRILPRESDPDLYPGRFLPVVRFGDSTPVVLIATNDGARPVVWNPVTDETSVFQTVGYRTKIVRFGAGDTRVLTSGENHVEVVLGKQRIQLWDFHSGEPTLLLEEYREDIQHAPVAASPRLVAAGDGKGIIRTWAWDGTAKGERATGQLPIRSIDVSATDDAIVTAHPNGVIRLWDSRLAPIVEIDARALNPPPEGGWLTSDFEEAYSARFTPDGEGVVIVGPGNLSVWDRRGVGRWNADVDPAGDVHISSDRVLLVNCVERGRGASLGGLSQCYDSRATLWDRDGRLIGTLEPGVEDEIIVARAAFNARGNRIVTVDRSGVTRLWDADGNLVEQFLGHASAASFDPAGAHLATVSENGVIRLWSTGDDLQVMVAEAERRLGRPPLNTGS